MVALLVLSGVQMFCFGIVGEYAGRTFLRVNDKPQTSIREVLNCDRTASENRQVETEMGLRRDSR
jgi:undecaprenyl-phosphate 4-deoxy-4-formamido-L-arabinose transferase